MEAGSVPSEPAGVEPTQTPQTDPAAEQQTAPDQAQGGIEAQVAAMRQEFDELKGAFEEQPQTDTGLLDRLLAPDPEEEIGAEGQPQAQPEQPQSGQQEVDPAFMEFQNYLDQRISEGLAPLQQERQDEQLAALEKQYPDLLNEDIFPKVENYLDSAVMRSGNEALKLDPWMVELAYKAVKAEMADAAAVPAEQVATDGASIETGAGSSQAGEPSLEEQYVQMVYGTPEKKSVFQ